MPGPAISAITNPTLTPGSISSDANGQFQNFTVSFNVSSVIGPVTIIPTLWILDPFKVKAMSTSSNSNRWDGIATASVATYASTSAGTASTPISITFKAYAPAVVGIDTGDAADLAYWLPPINVIPSFATIASTGGMTVNYVTPAVPDGWYRQNVSNARTTEGMKYIFNSKRLDLTNVKYLSGDSYGISTSPIVATGSTSTVNNNLFCFFTGFRIPPTSHTQSLPSGSTMSPNTSSGNLAYDNSPETSVSLLGATTGSQANLTFSGFGGSTSYTIPDCYIYLKGIQGPGLPTNKVSVRASSNGGSSWVGADSSKGPASASYGTGGAMVYLGTNVQSANIRVQVLADPYISGPNISDAPIYDVYAVHSFRNLNESITVPVPSRPTTWTNSGASQTGTFSGSPVTGTFTISTAGSVAHRTGTAWSTSVPATFTTGGTIYVEWSSLTVIAGSDVSVSTFTESNLSFEYSITSGSSWVTMASFVADGVNPDITGTPGACNSGFIAGITPGTPVQVRVSGTRGNKILADGIFGTSSVTVTDIRLEGY